MATAVEISEMERLVSCPICMETFDKPKMLLCQHSYCLKCIFKTYINGYSSGTEQSVICPECRYIHKFMGRNQLTIEEINKQLSNNYLLLSVLDVKQTIYTQIAEKSESLKSDVYESLNDTEAIHGHDQSYGVIKQNGGTSEESLTLANSHQTGSCIFDVRDETVEVGNEEQRQDIERKRRETEMRHEQLIREYIVEKIQENEMEQTMEKERIEQENLNNQRTREYIEEKRREMQIEEMRENIRLIQLAEDRRKIEIESARHRREAFRVQKKKKKKIFSLIIIIVLLVIILIITMLFILFKYLQ